MQTFKCRGCGEHSKVTGIQDSGGRQYVVCEHCGAKNELQWLTSASGAPAEFAVIGLIK